MIWLQRFMEELGKKRENGRLYCDSESVLVVEPNYLPDSEVFFSRAWTPFPNGGCGGDFPPQLSPRGGGGRQFLYPPPPPLVGDSGAMPLEAKILGKISL
jgi:hypothetical protein